MGIAADNFARNLKFIMDMKGITQTELAELSGISRVTIWKWLGGKTIPGPAYINKLSKALKCSRDAFYVQLPDDENERLLMYMDTPELYLQPGSDVEYEIVDNRPSPTDIIIGEIEEKLRNLTFDQLVDVYSYVRDLKKEDK